MGRRSERYEAAGRPEGASAETDRRTVRSASGRRRRRVGGLVALAGCLLLALLGVTAAPASAATRSFSAVDTTADGKGYALISSAGEVYAFGSVIYRGNPAGFTGKIVGISVTADGQGYVAISSAGQVYAYGTAVYRGNPTGFTGSITGISLTADGQGYAAISSIGQVYAYGTTVYRGNPAGFTGSIVGISVTADGQGYAAISSIGQVYAYGTAVPRGNPTGFTGGIVGISLTANGQGYAAESGIGQIYAYGTVVYWGNGDPGSASVSDARSRIVAIANREQGNGEKPAGSDCNFYTTALHTGSTAGCSVANYTRAEDWCADFAKWVWMQAGADVANLNAAAISFQSSRGGWHSGAALSGLQVGDVVGWNFGGSTGDDHVSVVVAINGNTISAMDGNWGNTVGSHVFSRGAAGISGYAAPAV
jgi:hypothetical protein